MKVTANDWFEINDHIASYVWCFDMGDVDTVITLFTPDGLFQDTAGNEYQGVDEIRGYFNGLVARPEFRGRQHHIDNLQITAKPDGFEVKSYWTITKWFAAEKRVGVEVVGHSYDRLVRGGEGLLFAERRVYHWRNDNCPWKPDGTAIG